MCCRRQHTGAQTNILYYTYENKYESYILFLCVEMGSNVMKCCRQFCVYICVFGVIFDFVG